MSITSLNLHGQIHMTLIDASPGDVRAVIQATGAREGIADREVDVEIEFVRDYSQLCHWRTQGNREVYGPSGRLNLYRAKGKLPIEIGLPVGTSDSSRFRAAYPTGLHRLPLLRSTLNLKSVEHSLLGIHGTAFTHDHHGYLVCGSPGSGKTGVLVAFLLQDARYLAAEWGYVSHEGQVIHGVPEILRLRDWHVQHAGTRLRQVCLTDRFQMAKWRYASNGLLSICRLLEKVGVKHLGRFRQFASRMDRQRYLDRPVSDWLGVPVLPRAAPLHTILLVSIHDTPDILVKPLDRSEAIQRLTALHDADLEDLLHANPMWNSDILELPHLLREFYLKRSELIDNLVTGKLVYSVSRPPNVNLRSLFQAIRSATRESCSLSH